MTLDIEGVVDRGVYVQEALRRAWRFEALLFALSSSDRLMRILRTIIRTLIVNVFSRQADGSKCYMIRSEFIGCDPRWRAALFL